MSTRIEMPEILRGGPRRTPVPARHPWPADCLLQGGPQGVVLGKDGSYRTAFVEAFPRQPDVFIRGEGPTIQAAEDAAWARYQKLLNCPAHPAHGPWDRRTHRNGYAWCENCGSGFGPSTTGLAELPTDPDQEPCALEQLLSGKPGEAIGQITDALDINPSGNLLDDVIAVSRAFEGEPATADEQPEPGDH